MPPQTVRVTHARHRPALRRLPAGTTSGARAERAQCRCQPIAAPLASAAPRSGAVVLDGRLDEAAWQAVQPVANFTQAQPREGEPATQRTEIRILYDDDALYIGARMFDTEGAAGIRTRLARRDNLPDADYVQVIFDTFHDHLGRVSFMVNPSGVKGDSYGPNGANLDDSWDAVWDVATRVDSLGWTAEFRIPFAQLRYPRDSVQTWGLQVWRDGESPQRAVAVVVLAPERVGGAAALRAPRGPAHRARARPRPRSSRTSSGAPPASRWPTPPTRSPRPRPTTPGSGPTSSTCSPRTSPSRRRSTRTSARSRWTPRS